MTYSLGKDKRINRKLAGDLLGLSNDADGGLGGLDWFPGLGRKLRRFLARNHSLTVDD